MKIKLLAIAITSLLLLLILLPTTTGDSSYIEGIEPLNNSSCHGFIIPVNSSQSNSAQTNISKLVNELLRDNVNVYWITSEINVSVQKLNYDKNITKKICEKGSFIVPFSDEGQKNIVATSIIYRHCSKSSIEVYKLMQELADLEVYLLVKPRIAIHGGPQVDSYSYAYCLRQAGFLNYSYLSYDEIPEKLNNDEYNVFIWGGGYGLNTKFCKAIITRKYKKATSKIKDFVQNGGGYVGSCGGQITASKALLHPSMGCDFTTTPIKDFFIFYNLGFPGYLAVSCKIVNFDNPVSYGVKEYFPMWHWRGPIIESYGKDTVSIGEYYDVAEVFPSERLDFIKDYCKKRMIGKPNIICSKLGAGKVVTFSSHPEIYFNLEKYTNLSTPVRLMHNAFFYVTSKGPFNIDIDNCIKFVDMNLEVEAPSTENVSELITFQCNVNNGSISPSCFYWDFDNGQKSNNQNPEIRYNKPGNYQVVVVVSDVSNNTDVKTLNISIEGDYENLPPEKPEIIYYSKIAHPFFKVWIAAKTNDPDGDFIKFKIIDVDTGEDLDSYLDNVYFESGQTCETYSNIYKKRGIYKIKVKAIDIHGAESDWTEPVSVLII